MTDNTYRFGKNEDQLLRLCRSHEINIEKIRETLSRGTNVNAIDDHGLNILEAVIKSNSFRNGKTFPLIAQELIHAGFDSLNLGYSCLMALLFSSYDRYIFDTSRILFDAGINLNNEQTAKLLNAIGTEESYQRCCDNDHACENIYYALYEMADKALHGNNYSGIQVWQDCKGLKIESIHCKTLQPLNGKIGSYVFETLSIICGEKTIVIDENPNIYIDDTRNIIITNFKNDAANVLSGFNSRIIKKVSFKHNETENGTRIYRQPVIIIHLDNGQSMCFTTNFGEVPKNETATIVNLA